VGSRWYICWVLSFSYSPLRPKVVRCLTESSSLKDLPTPDLLSDWVVLLGCAAVRTGGYLLVMKSKKLWFAKMGGMAILISWTGATNWTLAPMTAKAEVDFSVGVDINSPSEFYSPLAANGTWLNVASYGRCWHPAGIEPGWQPYTVGHWEWTDCGWYWVSDEPYAWACYHYGSWIFDSINGWVWIPGTEWAPAWVVWREAPDYIGWAPCRPGGVAVADSFFVFTDVHHFHDHLRRSSLVFNNPEILRRSRPVGGFHKETRDFDGKRRQIAINQGPGIEPIQRATGTKFTPRPVRELVRQTSVPENVRRSVAAPKNEQKANREPAQTQTGREQQRIYREAPQPAPTGRQEQRIYREAPIPQPTPQPERPSVPPPIRQPAPELPRPVPAPNERPLPGPGVERGKSEGQFQGREQPAPRVAPSPAPRQPAQPTPPSHEAQPSKEDGH